MFSDNYCNELYGEYTPIELTLEQKRKIMKEKEEDNIKIKNKQEEKLRSINQFIINNNLIKIKSDYYARQSDFYYDYNTKILYEIFYYGNYDKKITISNDEHILELNDIIN